MASSVIVREVVIVREQYPITSDYGWYLGRESSNQRNGRDHAYKYKCGLLFRSVGTRVLSTPPVQQRSTPNLFLTGNVNTTKQLQVQMFRLSTCDSTRIKTHWLLSTVTGLHTQLNNYSLVFTLS